MSLFTTFRLLHRRLPLTTRSSSSLRRDPRLLPQFRTLSTTPPPPSSRFSSSSTHPHLRDDPAPSSERDNEPLNGGFLMKNSKGGTGRSGDGRAVPAAIRKEANDDYMAYAMSVLGLPDVTDGLKPVHRRILYVMHKLGLSSKKPFEKCSTVVCEAGDNFHPRGRKAVYDELVRMTQGFSLRYPLIQGHGNFVSLDAYHPDAMYRRGCRLQALTEAVFLADLEQDAVDFVPNYDNNEKEPSLLPARLPMLLLNGSTGIAAGMAANIPPHNLGELVDVLCALIHNPEATLEELLEYMPGPDFPTGGLIMGNLGILEAYRTGRGCVIVRGKTDIELLDSETKRAAIVIKEVPYQTSKSALWEKLDQLVENKNLDGISDIRVESNRSAIRFVIELKREADPSIVLNNLYRMTPLECSFSCSMVGIVNGRPEQMGLKELLQAFLDFRCSVIERRTRFRLSHAQERRHIVEGLVVGIDNLREVLDIFDIFRKYSSKAAAFATLRKDFNLSEKQAEAIWGAGLLELSPDKRNGYVDEIKSLTEQIPQLEELLSSRDNIMQLIEKEAVELKNKFSTPRRSVLEDSTGGELEDIEVITNEVRPRPVSPTGKPQGPTMSPVRARPLERVSKDACRAP